MTREQGGNGMRRLILDGIFTALILHCRFAWASADSNGPNGINSGGLSLTGMGIGIGQVEPDRPGDPSFDGSQTLFNSTVDPDQVFYRQTNTNFAPTANLANEVDNHEVRVAGITISTDALAQGVAQQADLFSVGVNPQSGVPIETTYTHAAASINHLATLPGQRIWATNMSFLANTATNAVADGSSTLTSYVDWSAATHDILYVTGNPETGSFAVLADNFNGMTVAYSMKNGPKYREIGDENIFTFDDIVGVNRSFPDIIAPGTGILILLSEGRCVRNPSGIKHLGQRYH